MKPIAKKLLIHNVTVKSVIGSDRNRNPIYKTYTLKPVRIGATFCMSKNGYGYFQDDSLTMYVDCTNSKACDTNGDELPCYELKAKDVVIWDGKEYTIKSVTPCYATAELCHHFEVNLS